MTRTADLFAAAVDALRGATSADLNIYSALDFPTWNGSYPVLFVHTPEEDKEGLGRNGAPQFNVVATLTVEGRFQAPAEASNAPFDPGAATVEAALFALSREIEMAIINYPPLMRLLQQHPFIRTKQTITAEGEQHLGSLVTQIGLEFYQGPEDFYPVQTSVLKQVAVTTDLQNVFDPNGTYANPPFPAAVSPAPRTSGPDGRAEGYVEFNFNSQE